MAHFRISLEAARVNAKLTQAKAAERLGVSVQTLVNWEKGRSEPTISMMRKIADLYQIDLDYIFLTA